ncbi:hypothetical protein Nepgr_030425 [Nepenthes gracilis]|uniref:Uncharacterized protein n=1 Tax=Nepenthes gracilis TaxID=150966 RepID=A0AAD3TFS0_NEPGR|nr:hypothetical protein Nepgr_030425 [Nepenthes gracilis]
MKDIVPAQRYTKELEEHAKLMNEQTRMAKNEVEVLKIKIIELNQEKEHVALLYNQCMEVIYNQQSELTEAQEQAMSLSNVIRWGYAKLVQSEEQRIILGRLNESLQSEAHNLEQKLAIKDQQLSKMQANLEKLINNLQEQRCWFVQVKDTLHTLLCSHSQSQKQQTAITSELRNAFQMLKGLELCKKELEVNRILNDLTLPSSDFKRGVESKTACLREIRQDQVCHLMDDFRNPFGVPQVHPQVHDTLYHELEVGDQNSMNPSSEPLAKRELGMDKREVSNEGSSSNEEPKMENILNKFAPDALNLMGLKDSMQELRAKLETIKKRKIVKDVEHDKLRDRLQDVENSVTHLLGLYTEPRKTTEDRPISDDVTSLELNEIGMVQRKLVLNKVPKQWFKLKLNVSTTVYIEIEAIESHEFVPTVVFSSTPPKIATSENHLPIGQQDALYLQQKRRVPMFERYDGATGELLQAHEITGEAFPSQVSFLLADDAPSSSEPNTPFTRIPIHEFDPEEAGTAVGRKGLKHQGEDQEDLAQLLNKNKNLKTRILIESERAHRAENELQTLTQILTKTESERDAIIVQYRKF